MENNRKSAKRRNDRRAIPAEQKPQRTANVTRQTSKATTMRPGKRWPSFSCCRGIASSGIRRRRSLFSRHASVRDGDNAANHRPSVRQRAAAWHTNPPVTTLNVEVEMLARRLRAAVYFYAPRATTPSGRRRHRNALAQNKDITATALQTKLTRAVNFIHWSPHWPWQWARVISVHDAIHPEKA